MSRRKGAMTQRDVNVFSEEHSTDALYRELKRHQQMNAQDMHDYFVEIREADREFWRTVLWHSPLAFPFWLREVLPKIKKAYVDALNADDVDTVCGLIESEYLLNRSRWTADTQRRVEACVDRVARQLVATDGSHALWQHVVRSVTSEERPDGLWLRKYDEYVAAIVRKDQQVSELRNLLIVANLRFAIKLAIGQSRRSKTAKVWYADLVQEATLGLMEAVNRFDPSKGFAFTTYASYWLRHHMDRSRANTGRTVPHPVYIGEFKRKISNVTQEYRLLYNREPTEEELCENVKALTPTILKGMGHVSRHPASSLNDAMISSGGPSEGSLMYQDLVEDTFPSMEDITEHDQVIEALYKILDDTDVLCIRERDVLSSYFGLRTGVEKTLQEVGEKHGLTRERIRQIRDVALEKVREAFLEQNIVKEDCLSAFTKLSEHMNRGATHQLSTTEK